jgi:hypothetical protein
MTRQSSLGAAIRWFLYGGIVGLLIDLLIICATRDWHRWQTPAQLLANVLLVHGFGVVYRAASPCQCRHVSEKTSRYLNKRAGASRARHGN